jgi:DNA-binding Lrp family transcriptional regulator
MSGKAPSDTSNKKRRPTDRVLRELYLIKKRTLAAIGERYGVSFQAIQQRLSAMGVPKVDRRRTITPDLLRSMYVDFRLSRKEIAIKLGVSRQRIKQELERLKLRRVTALEYHASIHPRDEIVQIYVTEGLLQAEAASKLGMPTHAFQALLRYYAINERHKPGPKICEFDDNDLLRLYAEDRHSIADIGAIFGCDDATIRTHLKRLGIYVARPALPDDKTLVELYTKRGLTYKQIGERYGVTAQAVYRRLAAMGIRRSWARLDKRTLRALYTEQRLTQRAIAAKLGVTRYRVCADLEYHGIHRDT